MVAKVYGGKMVNSELCSMSKPFLQPPHESHFLEESDSQTHEEMNVRTLLSESYVASAEHIGTMFHQLPKYQTL